VADTDYMPSFVRFALALGVVLAINRAGSRAATAQDGPLNALEGVLSNQPAVAADRVRQKCVELPGDFADEVLGPHGDTLLSTQCQVVSYETLAVRQWSTARYAWTAAFTAEDATRGVDALDTATIEEVVLFETSTDRSLRPVWHTRFDSSKLAVWRSITPEVALTAGGTMLVSIMSCVNGTGGCGQDFLHRHRDGRWFAVTQQWLKELPSGYAGRIRHGVRIDPQSLHGTAGFYGDGDANCCPSQMLEVDLALRGDLLVLQRSPRLRSSAAL
jgi:hypothetical protein